MANYKKGSSGPEVENLQNALISAGYDVGSTGADGVYGSKTEAAVKQYQKDNGLTVDGIAGKNTLGALYSTPAASTPTAPSAPSTPTAPTVPETPTIQPQDTQTPAAGQPNFSYPEFAYKSYDENESDNVKQANALLQQHSANKPGEYTPVWQDEADSYLSQYQNREDFSYDFNKDALYNQYKDQYIQQGKMAMMDTMGQAASMTGGYGNSYAQTVGQQAYNQQLNQLNEIMPELYNMALNRYTQEGQDLLNMYNIYMGKEEQEYGRYQDNYNNWYTQWQDLTNQYNTERELDYNKYSADRSLAYDEYNTGRTQAFNDYWNTTNLDYEKSRDAVSDAQWQATFDENKRQSELSASKSSGTGTKATTYTKLTADESNKWEKKFESQTTVKGIEFQADAMQAAGVDPQVVAAWVDYYKELLVGEQPVVDPPKSSTQGVGGGGGGRMVYQIK